MSLIDLLESREAETKIQGVVIGIVTNNKDPDGLGRIKVKFPWLSNDEDSNWARIASPMTGKDKGMFFLPEVNDEVLVAFQHADMSMPYIIGSLWNGVDKPPETNSDGKNNIQMIKSKSGHIIKLDNTPGKEKIEVIDKTGKNTLTIDSRDNKISLMSEADVEISAPKGKIIINAKDIEITSSANTKIGASAGMDLKSSEDMNIKGAIINLN